MPGHGDDLVARRRRPARSSRSALGTFASTSRSCTFLRRPARRSPGRRARTSRSVAVGLERPRPPRRPRPRAAACRTRARRGRRRRGRPPSCRPARRAARRATRSSAARQARALVAEREQVRVGARVQPPQQRQDLVPDQPARRVRVRRVDPHGEAVLARSRRAVSSRQHVEQRPHDAVLAARLDPARSSRSRRAGRGPSRPGPRRCARSRAARGPRWRRSAARAARPRSAAGSTLHDARRRARSRSARRPRRLRRRAGRGATCTAATSVAERREHVPEAGRVGAAGDEAGDLAARRDQVVGADERLDARCQRRRHTPSVPDAPVGPTASASASPRRRPGRPAAARRRAGSP